MYLVYLDNNTYRNAKSVAEDLATDEHKVQYRNPEHFSGAREFRKADKVFIFGSWPQVAKAAKEAEIEYKVLKAPTKEPGQEDTTSDNNFQELPEDTEFPYNYGGNWYFLSDGSKVQGEQAAIEAQEALNETDDG